VNSEQEFTVSSASVFNDLIRRLGLVPGIKKHKKGWAWNCTGSDNSVIRAELSQVKDLGWFIELEILESEDCALQGQKISERQKSLLELLEKLGISPEKIEKRPYTVMLRSLQDSL
jgi:adenylate cyclase class IV